MKRKAAYFVINVDHKDILNFKPLLQAKMWVLLSIILLSLVKKLSHLNQEINIKHCLQAKTVQNSSKQMLLDFYVEYNRTTNMHLITSQMLIWIRVDYLWIIVMFLSAIWTLFVMAPIHCRGSIGEQLM